MIGDANPETNCVSEISKPLDASAYDASYKLNRECVKADQGNILLRHLG